MCFLITDGEWQEWLSRLTGGQVKAPHDVVCLFASRGLALTGAPHIPSSFCPRTLSAAEETLVQLQQAANFSLNDHAFPFIYPGLLYELSLLLASMSPPNHWK